MTQETTNSINGFTTDDLEASLPSLVFPSSYVMIFWVFAGFIYHWPKVVNDKSCSFTMVDSFFCVCVDLAPLIDNIFYVVDCSGLSVRYPPISSLSPSLQEDRVRK